MTRDYWFDEIKSTAVSGPSRNNWRTFNNADNSRIILCTWTFSRRSLDNWGWDDG